MNPCPIRFDLLFDADEYHRSGPCPWTFFAYPTSLADERGLPPDNEVCDFLGSLQERGIDVAIWPNGIAEDTTYFACRKEDIQRLHNAIQELEDSGTIKKGFCNERTERLFAASEKHRTYEETYEETYEGLDCAAAEGDDDSQPHDFLTGDA